MKYPRYDAFRSLFRYGIVCLALWLCSGVASALGLGEIRVISRPGEPLIAQIPIVSNAMGELEQAHVGLASDDVFQRVGVDPPDALVRGLQFTFAKDAHDHALIWVTSQSPINQRAVNFLIALEWPQGRLVREYTALVDTPVTFASQESPAPSVMDGPDAASVHSPAADRGEQPPSGAKDSVPDQGIGALRAPPPIPLPPPADAARVPPAPAAASPVALPAAGEPLLTVEKGQTLSEIAQDVADASGSSLNQAMLALLQANPKAFIHGNVNALKQGAILRTPRHNDFERYSAAQARAMIRQQLVQWRQARAPLPQPADDGHRALPEQERALPAAAVADHDRLEIASTVTRDLHQNRGTVSGTSASEGGDMQDVAQLQQAHEDLASRQIEIQELHSRIDELERLKQKQDHLLQLKDSALAEATVQLAKQNAQQTSAPVHMPWMGIAEASSLIAMAAIIAWLIARRASRPKTVETPSPLPLNRSEGAPAAGEMRHALDAKGAGGVATDWVAATSGKEATGKAGRIGFAWFKRLSRTRMDDAPSAGHQQVAADVPKWAASSSQWMAFAPQRASRVDEPSPASEQQDSAADDRRDASTPSSAAVVAPPPVDLPLPASVRTPQRAAKQTAVDSTKVRDRLELARAYLELGDRTTAKMLLDEVMSSDDHKVRSDAIELSKQLS